MNRLKSIVLPSVLVAVITAGVSAQSKVRRTSIADRAATRVVTDTVEDATDHASVKTPIRAGVRGASDILWTFDDNLAIPETVALSESSGSAWVAQDLNSQRLQRFLIQGVGTPGFEVPAMPSSLTVAVAAAQFADLAVFAERTDPVSLRAFSSAGTTPLWDFTAPAAYTYIDAHSAAVSADGSIVCYAVRDVGPPEATRLYILNGATGAELNHWDYPARVERIDLNDDGSLCWVREGSNGRLIDTATVTETFTVNGSGLGGGRISGDGQVLVYGGYSFFGIYKKSGASYSPVIASGGGNISYEQVAVSRDGTTVAVLSIDAGTLLDLTLRVYDVPSSSVIDSYSFSGTGIYQAVPSDAQISDDGSIIAISHWGFQNNDHPEVLVFNRDVDVINSLDTDGSPSSIDLSADGRFLLCGSKSVHANITGNGGTVTMLQVFEPRILYVDDDAAPGGDGLSWVTAFDDLQDALDAAMPGDQIWVAAGTYVPSQRSNPADARSVTFQLIDEVAIYGGFAGSETVRSDRDVAANRTTLSGDVLGDDDPFPESHDDNAYHVVTGSGTNPTAILDGFWIEAGWAFDTSDPADRNGGGMRNIAGSPTVRNDTFYNNTADTGGGGMYNESGSAPHVIQTVFIRNGFNYANVGGGMSNAGSSPIVTNSLFNGNYALTGAGMYNDSGSDPIVANTVFWDNGYQQLEDEQVHTEAASVDINYCCVMGWTGSLGGTGNFGDDPGFVDLVNRDFRLRADSPCLDAGDSLALPADADDLDEDGNVTELLPLDAAGEPRFVDAVCGGDTGVPLMGSSAIVDIGLFESNTPGPAPAARLYVLPGATGTGDGSDWTNAYTELRDALDAANDYACVVDEIWVAQGTYKPTAGTDRSATFHLASDVAVYGGFSGTESLRGVRNPNPLTNNTILSGDIGASPDVDDNAQSVVTASYTNSNAVLDGFALRDGNADAGAFFTPATSGGAFFGLYAGATVRNCLFEDNRGRLGAGVYTREEGSLTFEDCYFRNNLAIGAGGAIGDGGGAVFYYDSKAILRRCEFTDNNAPDGSGGALRIDGAVVQVIDSTFSGNSGFIGGAFIADAGADAAFFNCSFVGNHAEITNTATVGAGGVGLLLGGSTQMVNCQMSHNWAEDLGGALLLQLTDDVHLTNCTINSNGASDFGGGIYILDDSHLNIDNSILWGNTDNNGVNNDASAQIFDDPSLGPNVIDVSYSCVQNGDPLRGGVYPGVGNIDTDPKFADAVADDVHLGSDSPCIDTGSTGLLPQDDYDIDGDMNTTGPIPIDLEGNPRVQGDAVDMGAFESQADTITFQLDLNRPWMYQNLPGQEVHQLSATASAISDPLGNSSYSYIWQIILPADVAASPHTIAGGGSTDTNWTFAAPDCSTNGLSDTGLSHTLRLTITGDQFGNSGTVDVSFGICLLGDVNNDSVVNVADRAIANAFWRTGSAGTFTAQDCDVNNDSVINVADRAIVNAVWRGTLCTNSVSVPCALR